MLPSLPNYPVIDAAYIDGSDNSMMLQMKAGKSKKLSADDKTLLVHQALGDLVVIVTPEENIATKKLAGGPNAMMNQYVAVLSEE